MAAPSECKVEVIVTPTQSQYRQLVRDLEVLREAGAESNTAAVCDVAHEAATRVQSRGEES